MKQNILNAQYLRMIKDKIECKKEVKMLNKDYVLLPNGAKIFRGATINLVPIPTGTTARRIEGNYEDAIIGENTVVYPGAVIYAGAKIGKNCLICNNSLIREGCVIGDNCLIASCVTLNYNVQMGNRVKVMNNTNITGGMIIGNDVFISCLVATTNDNTMGRHKGTICTPPRIHSKAVIGAGANILPGVIIGHGATIAAGAVVTHNVRKGARVFGIPARERK